MSQKRYFFRDNNYSIIEMIKRLDIEILLKYVTKDKKNNKSKITELFLNNKDNLELIESLKKCFQLYGQKGDIANIRIYNFESYKYDLLSKEVLNIIKKLKGKELNNIGLLASFIEKGKCYLEDIKVTEKSIDYKFKFEYETIIESEGEMVKQISYNIVESRHYIKEKLVGIVDNLNYEIKATLGMIHSIPYYAKYMLSEDNVFEYQKPDYKQIELNSIQLQSIKGLLGGRLKYTVLDMKSERGVKVKVEGEEKDFENNSQILKQSVKNGDNREVQFYWKDSADRENRITIKSNCQIISTRYLTQQALKQIIDCIILVNSKQSLLIPIKKITEKYCAATCRKALVRRSINTKAEGFIEELKKIIKNIVKNINLEEFVPTNLYCTICLNIIIQALISKVISSDDPKIVDFVEYDLSNLVKWYMEYEHKTLITDDELYKSLMVLTKCIKIAGQSENKLLDAYYSFQ